jgi:gliding motility-associated-like protein
MKKRLLSISLKLTLIVGIFISSILKVDAQSFLISFPNNPQDVTACYSSELLTVRLDAIVNSTTGGDVVITLPNGVEYVPTSVAMISGSSGISISENGGTLNAPIFKINPGTLNIADYIIFSIKRVASCESYNNVQNGEIFFDKVTASMNGVSNEVDSPPYNIKYPSLSLEQPVAQNDALLFDSSNAIATTYTRTFSITNGAEGCTDNVYFSIEYPNADIQQVSLILGGNSIAPTSSSGNVYYYQINGTAFGADSQFCNGESLVFTETYRILKCNGVTNYATGWGCDSDPANWCQTSTGQGVVTMIEGVPQLGSFNTELIGYVDMCTPYVMRTTYTTAGTGNPLAATIYDTELRIGRRYYDYVLLTTPQIANLSTARVRNTSTGTLSAIVPFAYTGGHYTYNLNNFFTSDPDGAGVGLEDVDNDGYYDDLLPGSTVVLDIEASFNCVAVNCGNSYSGNGHYGYAGAINYHTLCNRATYEMTSTRNPSGFRGFLGRIQVTATGNIPANIEPGVPFSVRGSYGAYTEINDWRTTDSRYIYEFTLPAGTIVSNVKWANGTYPSGALAPYSGYTVSGNILTVTAPTNATGWTTFDLTYDCSSGIDYEITYKILDRNSPSCDCVQEIACGTLSALSDCNTCLNGPKTKIPKVERADNSLGWTDYTLTTHQTRANISAYDLSKALYLDEIEITGNAIQNGTSANLFLKMDLPKAPGNISKLTPLDIEVEIYRVGVLVSSGTVSTSSSTGSTTTMQNIIWDLTSALPMGGLLDQDEIRTVSSYQVAINSGLPTHDVQSGNSFWFYNVDLSGNKIGCDPKMPEMYLVGLRQLDGHNQALANGCAPTILGQYHHVATRFDPSGVNYQNEFRPGGYLTKYELTTSNAYSLASGGNIPLYINGAPGNWYTMSPNSVVGNTYTYLNPGTWPAYSLTIENTYGMYIRPTFQPNCAAENSTEHVTGKVYLNDFYYHYADPNNTTYQKIYTWSPIPNFSNSPGIEIADETGLIQASETIETFRVQLFNPTSFTAPYTWIAIPDTSGVTIQSLVEESTGNTIMGIPYSGPGGSGFIYHLSTTGLGSGQSKFYQINFSYTACDQTDIEVLTGWNCTEFLSDPNGTACGPKDSILLSFNPQIAEVEISSVSEPVMPADLCTPLQYEFQVNSAQAGSVVNTTFTIIATNGTEPVVNSFQAEYPSGAGNWEVIPYTLTGNQYSYDLTAHSAFPIGGLPGTLSDGGNPANRVINVKFEMGTNCNFLSGSNFEVRVNGSMSCGQIAIGSGNKIQTSAIYIDGITTDYYVVNDLSIDSSSIGNFNTCGEPITLQGSQLIISGGSTTNGTGYIEIRLPEGYHYISNSYSCTSSSCVTFDGISTGANNTEIITLLIPSGLSSGSLLEYTLNIAEDLTNPLDCGPNTIEVVSLDNINNVPCITEPGGQCPSVPIETGSYDFNFTIEKAKLEIQDNTVSSVVNGTNEEVTINFTVNNISTVSTMPIGTVIDVYYDANSNATFDITDVFIDDYVLSNAIPASGSLTDEFTFSATPQQVCNILLVIDREHNPCICSSDFDVVNDPSVLSGIAGADQTICANSSATLGITNNSSYTYLWTGATSYLNSTNSAQPTFSYSGTPLLVNTDFTYTLTVTRPNGCTSTDEVIVTVKPAPVGTNATETICSGTTLSHNLNNDVTLTGNTFVWSAASNSNVNGETTSSQTSSSITDTLVNTTNSPQIVVYTITPTGSNACPGNSFTYSVIVNPTPSVNSISDQSLCNGSNTTAITFSGAVSGTTYTWTNNTTSIGLAASGTGNIASFTATNTTTAPVTATITVTPHFANGGTTCDGTAQTFTITVNPTAQVNDPTDQVVCNGQSTTAVNFTTNNTGGTTTYTWTNNTTSIGLAASGTGNIASFTAINTTTAPVTATITVTPHFANGGTTCDGTAQTFTITVNPTAQVNDPADQVVCNGQSTTAVTFTTNNTGGTTTYTWTNNTTSIGLAASGTGNIASFTATNTTTAPVTATITVTPHFANGGTTCDGTAQTFTITVNPTAQVNDPTDQVVCNGQSTTAVNFTTNNIGGTTTYTWTNNTTSIGLAASGTGNIASFTATNTTTAPVTATITVTPHFANGGTTCDGTAQTFTITVNPTAQVNDPADQVVCNGQSTTAVTFTTNNTGGTTTYTWTNNTTSIGLAASGTGNIASFTATNTTTAPVTATITVTPHFANGGTTCDGTAQTFTITVNPTAQVNDPTDQVVCNGQSTTAVNFTTNNTGGTTTYTWTNNTTSIGLAASGTGNIASFTAINTTTAPVTATITVTPHFANGGTTCDGTAQTFTITVNPTAQVNDPADQVVCNGQSTTAVNFTTNNTGGTTTYTWTNNTTSIGLAASGTGNIASFTATNTTTAPVTATITVTPHFANGGTTCDGTAQTFTITVNPTAQVNDPTDQVVCNGQSTTAVNFTTNNTGGTTTYTWTNNTTSIGLAASGTGNIASFTAINTTTAPVTATITVTPHFANGGTTCDGTAQTFTITVNPTAQVNDPTDQVVCNGQSTTAVNFTTNNTGGTTTYTWTNNTTSIGLATSGTGNIASFTATNTTTAPVTATITVTPHFANGGTTCDGTAQTFTITVNPTAQVNDPTDQVVCNGQSTTAVNFTTNNTGGTTTYTWTNNTTSIGLAASGTGNIASFTATNTTVAPITAIITLTPHFSYGAVTCDGPSQSFTITVNPEPVGTNVAEIVCSGSTLSHNLSNDVTLTSNSFVWAAVDNSNVSGETTSAQTTSVITDTLLNTTQLDQIVVYNVTPISSLSCYGEVFNVNVTVHPQPVGTNQNITICSNAPLSLELNSYTSLSGNTYTWIAANNPNVEGESTLLQNTTSIGDVLTNNTTSNQVVLYTVTPTSQHGCVGASFTITVTVQPSVTANDQTTSTCSAIPLNLNLSTYVSLTGTTFNWYAVDNSNVSGETLINQTTSSITDVLVNTTSTDQVVDYVVATTSSVGCAGQTFHVFVTVHPQPVGTPYNATICSGTSPNINLSDYTSLTGNSYQWYATNNVSVNGESTTTQNTGTITDVLVNTTTTNQTVVYHITPISSSGCPGNTFTINVTVQPQPIVSIPTQTICSNDTLGIDIQDYTSLTGSTFTWVANDNVSVTGESTTTQNTGIIDNTLINLSGTNQVVVYTITPYSSAGCQGNPYILPVIVKPTPSGTNQTFSVCSDIALNINLSNYTNISGNTFQWFATDNANVTGESLTTQNSSVINDILTNMSGNTETVVYTVIPFNTNGCSGVPFYITINIQSEPVGINQQIELCSGSGLNLNLDDFVSMSNVTYTWSGALNSQVLGITTNTQFTSTISDILTNVSLIDQQVVYTITPSYNGSCVGNSFTITVTVHQKPQGIGQIFTICSNDTLNLDLDTFTSLSGNTYEWQAIDNTQVTGESTSTQTTGSITDTLVNLSGVDQTVVYTIIPISSEGCYGTPYNIIVTVQSEPVGTSQTDVICSGDTLSHNLSDYTTMTGNTYTWTVADNTQVTGESTGTQTTGSITDTLVNLSGVDQTVVYTIIPSSSAGCEGEAFTLTVTVQSEPVGTSQTDVICSGDTLSHNLSDYTTMTGNTYSWTVADNTQVTGESTGTQTTGSITDTLVNLSGVDQTVVYTIIPSSSAGCEGEAFTLTVTVQSEPVGTSQTDVICSGDTLSHNLSDYTTMTGNTYSWTVADNTQVTGESTGTQTTGSITDTLVNLSGVDQTVVYTIIPSSSAGCEGEAFTLTVTVQSESVGTSQTDVICSGDTLSHNLSDYTTMTGNTYSWTVADNTQVTGESTGTQTTGSITDTLVNLSGVDQTVVYTIIPSSSAGCEGEAFTLTVTVHPEVQILSEDNQVLCNGQLTLQIDFETNLIGGIYYWSNSDPTIGLPLNGIGNIPAFTAINTTNNPIIATISVYAVENGCTSINTITFTITINPTPHIPEGPGVQTYCEEVMYTVGNLLATDLFADDIVWYDAPVDGNVLLDTDLLHSGMYYAEGVYTTGCVSNERLVVQVIIDENCEFINIEKTANIIEVDAAGDQIIYTFTVTNINNYPLQNVTVSDALVPNIVFVSGDLNANNLLDVNETWIYTAILTVTQAMIDHCGIDATGAFDGDGDIDNIAIANAKTMAGISVPSAQDDEYVLINYLNNNSPSFEVTKVADRIEVRDIDEVIIYTITVVNTSNYALANVSIDDPLLDNETYTSGDTNNNSMLDLNETWIYTGTFTCTQAILQGFGVDPYGNIDDDGTIDNIVTVYAETPCGTSLASQQAEVSVDIKYIFIPEGFSPDGDNYNDTFEISGVEVVYPDFTLEIYNRWGNIVYDYSNNGSTTPQWWDGISGGRVTLLKEDGVPEGTYYYILDPNNGVDEPIVNWVFVNRK